MKLFDQNKCIICSKETVEEYSALSSRGMGAMLKSCEVRETVLLNYLSLGQEKFSIHNSCKKSFTDPRQHKKIKVDKSKCSTQSRVLRSSVESFSWKTKCFLCTEAATVDRHQSFVVQSAQLAAFRSASTLEIRETVINHCHVRNDDDFSLKVLDRLQSCCDLVAEEAVYHNTCLSYFLQTSILQP